MHTPLPDHHPLEALARDAADLIKSCVHCGFCLPACPTYQLLGDELDSPRGRIYLIKQMAEGNAPTDITQQHLDRCLTCRACETACPSGVRYGRLIDVGREMVAQQAPRPAVPAATRAVLGMTLSNRSVFGVLLGLGRLFRALLPRKFAASIPVRRESLAWPPVRHSRRMIVLEGCVQPALQPGINAAAAVVLDRIGISLERDNGGCCGALNHHLSREEAALAQVRRNVDAWSAQLDAGAEGFVITASGCGVMVKDYGHVLRDDPLYAKRAARVSAVARDICEVISPQEIEQALAGVGRGRRVAWQSPCTLQHGQKIRGQVESLLNAAGFQVVEPTEPTRCCGSAGTYSILQPELSTQLRELKVKSLEAVSPDVIATGNIGCLQHLSAGTAVPVRHWVEILAGQA
jgi:glycolate oxidase iron-sulfur subunit